MKVLCIGNSFSQNATACLQDVSNGAIFARNLFHGGCSLKRHYDNMVGNVVDYEYQENAKNLHSETIDGALSAEDWDVITVQQVSQDSGLPETYEPYLEKLLSHIKEKCPRAEIMLLRTWAYHDKTGHGGFQNYERDREKMFCAIVKTTSFFAQKYALPIIPIGNYVEKARENPIFHPLTEQYPLNLPDGFHLSREYGEYLAGLVFAKTLIGLDPLSVSFIPDGADANACAQIRKICALS